MSLSVGGGPISAVTEAPRLDYLCRSPPSRPDRGYGAGPAAVNGGSTGLVIAATTILQIFYVFLHACFTPPPDVAAVLLPVAKIALSPHPSPCLCRGCSISVAPDDYLCLRCEVMLPWFAYVRP